MEAVRRRLPQAHSVGLMTTDGTISSRIYHEVAQRQGLEAILPDGAGQERVMAMIYDGVKRGRPVQRQVFDDVVDSLRRAGADAVVAGCTEISVLCGRFGARSGYMVDSIDVLARRTVELAGGRVRAS